MTTKITISVSFDKLLDDMSAEKLIQLRQAIDDKLQSFVVKSEPIEQIEISSVLSFRTCNALSILEIKYLSDLKKYSQEYLKKCRGIGNKTLKEIQDIRLKYNV